MIFKHSVDIHENQDSGKIEISDTTVQENNITGRRSAFPTDAKLAKKIIDKCNGIAKKLGVTQRQTTGIPPSNWYGTLIMLNILKEEKRLKRSCVNSKPGLVDSCGSFG